jgi:hypothetical protein
MSRWYSLIVSFLLASSAFGQTNCTDAGPLPLFSLSIASESLGDSGPSCGTSVGPLGTRTVNLSYTITYGATVSNLPDSAMSFLIRLSVAGGVVFQESRAASTYSYDSCQVLPPDALNRVFQECIKRVSQAIDISPFTANAPAAIQLFVSAIPAIPHPRDADYLLVEAEVGTPLQLRSAFGIGTGVNDPVPGGPGMETKSAGSAPIAASYPLGALFYLQLAKADGTPVPSQYTMGAQSVTPALTEAALFEGKAVLKFGDNSAAPTTYFRAVHLGTAQLTVAPQDGSTQPITVNITVVRPSSLGGTPTTWDSALIDFGHKKGIPPSFMKGQIRQENKFDPMAYRYEPISVDCLSVSRGGNFRTVDPFHNYRLATVADSVNGPLSQGTKLVQADIEPRSLYWFDVARTRKIANSDQFVSAVQIFEANDGGRPKTQNWLKVALEPKNPNECARNPGLLSFTAQTTIAASYGLFQILFTTAIRDLKWQGVGPEKAQNPSLLFDTSPNHAKGGGTIGLAAEFVFKYFPGGGIQSPADFVQAFRGAYRAYNSRKEYSPGVIANAASFPPSQSTSIFQ